MAPQTVSATGGSLKVLTNNPSQPRGYSTWKQLNPVSWFGNADEPIAPDGYRAGQCCRNFMWHLRNPCHNLTFYVVGIADKPFTRVGRFPENVGNPNGGWNWAVCRYKCLRLPFVAYDRSRFHFYCGWRERGNLGFKFNFAKEENAPSQKPGACAPLAESYR